MKITKPMTVRDDTSVVVRTPMDTIDVLKKFYSDMNEQEHFSVIILNSSHEIIELFAASTGTVNKTIVHPREIFRKAILENAVAIILSHNHPSGNPRPSEEDIETTDVLIKASKIIGIEVLDHIIVSDDNYYSFKEHNLMFDDD